MVSNNFIWTYTKRSNYRCPQCGQLRANRFENPDKEIAPEQFAKCNRANKCGYELRPDKPEGTKEFTPKHDPVLEAFFMPKNWVEDNRGDLSKNMLYKAICKIFYYKNVFEAFNKYRICTDKNGATIFPQIDKLGRCRTAKTIIYMSNGKRNKQYGASFLHIKNGFLPERHALKQCLFGEHLLNESVKKVYIVESEKTAIICEICKKEKDIIFLATGGLQNLSLLLRCRIEKHQELFLIPDNSAEQLWSDKIMKLGIKGTIKPIEKIESLQIGYDIADILIYKKLKR